MCGPMTPPPQTLVVHNKTKIKKKTLLGGKSGKFSNHFVFLFFTRFRLRLPYFESIEEAVPRHQAYEHHRSNRDHLLQEANKKTKWYFFPNISKTKHNNGILDG